jgi:hypothetical protein
LFVQVNHKILATALHLFSSNLTPTMSQDETILIILEFAGSGAMKTQHKDTRRQLLVTVEAWNPVVNT